ncbi:unnamed protein product [Menidia menidia]|uniref:UDP-glucuronosyltransferase n=1 Tax=Menidia menidia TaxID=238744 RepID=A0A8S4AEA7_9TELE|nr:unnamed protein product [Menidia menidia]
MDIMIRALHLRGHLIDVVRTNQSWYIQEDSPHYKAITIPVVRAFDHHFIDPILKKIIAIERGESPVMSFVSLQYQAVCDKFFGSGITYGELLRGADLWLMRVDFVFEFPRPTMPNIIHVGGFQCKPSKTLPEHLEEFVQSSGEHGVIIMSLGTFVNELPDDVANGIAATFAKLPQKVIWSYKGRRPSTLGNNTLVVKWMPQNDLLGHPKVKLFVAHGGTNGVQEAIYHGVPVVGIPLFYDQYDNLLRLEERGAAKTLTVATVDKDDNFLEAIQAVLNEPSYRMNMQRLSRLHRDKPMMPMDSALFWIEFVMRHKGAAHLKAQAYRMPWYSYYSIDVALFALAIFTLTILGTALCFRRQQGAAVITRIPHDCTFHRESGKRDIIPPSRDSELEH